MKILENKLLLTLVLALFSLQILAVPTDVAISFDEVYPYSIAYSISNLNNVQQNKNCSFVNSLTNQILECELGEQCKCSEGTLIGLEANTVYPIMVRIKPDNVELIPSTDVKTAAVGELEWSYGISTVTYNISYSRNQVAPFSCDPTLISSDSDYPDVYQLVADRSCESGTFTGLLANREYSLTISSNGSVIHENVVNTGYFNVIVNQTGIKSVGFYSQTNLDDIYLEECEIFNNSTGAPASCLDGQCSCTGGIINDLQPNTNYSFRFIRGVDTLFNLSLITASTGAMEFEYSYAALIYNTVYPNNTRLPESCVPCLYISTQNFTLEECIESTKSYTPSPIFCTKYVFRSLSEGATYNTVLFDNNYDVVGQLNETKVRTTVINQTSIQLYSAGYQIETDFPIDLNQPCQFMNSYGSLYYCELELGDKSTNCSCQAGKLVGLPDDAYIYFNLYQNSTLIGTAPRFYTAYTGAASIDNFGIYSMQYSVFYYSLAYPPQNCIACVVPVSNDPKTCDKTFSINSAKACNEHKFSTLSDSTYFNLLIFDGDKKKHTDMFFYTAGVPVQSVFSSSENSINYTLSYESPELVPSQCLVYFIEDPSYPVQCTGSFTCDCFEGSVVLPADNKNLTRIYITDFSGDVIAEMSVQRSSKLSGGAIAGIVIGVILVIAIVAGVTAYFVTKK